MLRGVKVTRSMHAPCACVFACVVANRHKPNGIHIRCRVTPHCPLIVPTGCDLNEHPYPVFMAHLLSYLSRRLPAALAAVQHVQVLQGPAAAAVTALQQPAVLWDSQLLERLRSNHTASCSHNHSHEHSHGQGSPSFEEQEATCWSCHDRFHRGGLVCQACDKIQPSDPSLTHYDILG
jgi:hypothetical protein